MDILKLIVPDEKHRMFCSLCFKVDVQFIHIDDIMEIVDATSNNTTTSLRNIFNSLFPFYETISQQLCEDCTKLIIDIHITISQGIMKLKAIREISEKINGEIESISGCVKHKLTIFVQNDKTFEYKLKSEARNMASKKHKITCNTPASPASLLQFIGHNFVCDTCRKSFKRKSSLKTHLESHKVTRRPIFDVSQSSKPKSHAKETKSKRKTTKNTYKCNVNACDYTTCNEHDLKAHTNKKHLNCRPHKCLTCQKSFFSNKNLQEHFKIHRKDKYNMICDICGERFAHRKSLEYHLRSHNNFRPYVCTECGHKFVSLSQRNEHTKRKHGPKAFNCNFCNKKYGIGKELKRHIKMIHTTFPA